MKFLMVLGLLITLKAQALTYKLDCGTIEAPHGKFPNVIVERTRPRLITFTEGEETCIHFLSIERQDLNHKCAVGKDCAEDLRVIRNELQQQQWSGPNGEIFYVNACASTLDEAISQVLPDEKCKITHQYQETQPGENIQLQEIATSQAWAQRIISKKIYNIVQGEWIEIDALATNHWCNKDCDTWVAPKLRLSCGRVQAQQRMRTLSVNTSLIVNKGEVIVNCR